MSPIDRQAAQELMRVGESFLPGHLGIEILSAAADEVRARLAVRPHLLAPNGFLHGGTVVALADTLCGYGTLLSLPEEATGFATLELKTNFLGTTREGALLATARPVHRGRSTQVWDATVTAGDGDRPLALFRCTQSVLRTKG